VRTEARGNGPQSGPDGDFKRSGPLRLDRNRGHWEGAKQRPTPYTTVSTQAERFTAKAILKQVAGRINPRKDLRLLIRQN